MIDISGQRCFASSRHSNRGTLLARMCEGLLTSKTAWSSRLCALTWKAKDTKFNRSLFQLQASVLPTGEKESGLLPTEKNLWSTPTTFDSNNIQQPRKNHPGGGQVPPLNQQVMLPTPRANEPGRTTKGYGRGLAELVEGKEQVEPKMWATPNTMDYLPPRSEEGTRKLMEGQRKGRTGPSNLREQVDPKTMQLWRTPTTMDSKEDSLKHATKLLQGKNLRSTGARIQITLADEVMVEEIKANPELMEQYKDYEMVTRKNLPEQQEFVDYMREQTTVAELFEKTGIKRTTIEHWFRRDKAGFSHPSIEDWEQIKPHLKTIKYDKEMTTLHSIEWKEEIKSMWPTPTTKGFGHASEGQTMIMRRKVEAGELTEQEAQAMMNGTTLRPPRMKEWMWPTPQAADHLANQSETLEAWEKRAAEKKKEGINLQFALRHAVQKNPIMWPTPTAGDHSRNTIPPSVGKSRGYDLSMKVVEVENQKRMWPTPRASGQENLDTLIKRKGETAAVQHNLTAAVQKWPTPTARDWKDSGKAVVNSTRHLLPQAVAKSDKEKWITGGGALNPTWVEWLMGYPGGYTDLKDWAILSSRKSSKKSAKQSLKPKGQTNENK